MSLKGGIAWDLLGYQIIPPLKFKVFAQKYSHLPCCEFFGFHKKKHLMFVTFNLDRRPRSLLLQSCLDATEQPMAYKHNKLFLLMNNK